MTEQMDIFDLMYKDFKFRKDKPIRIIEMFAGIGTQKMAFKRLGIPHEVIAIVEVDKFAMLSYAAIHTDYLKVRANYDFNLSKEEMVEHLQEKNIGINFTNMKQTITMRNNIEIVRDYYLVCILTNNLGDISKVKGTDLPKGIDMLTYSFPCTDLSKAGQQKGLDDTRSGLVYEVFRIIEELKEINNKPSVLIMENVIDLIQAKFVKEFNEMQKEVADFGYINYNFVMNAKDFGVAQNRNRVFMVSLPLESNYKEPKPFKLEKKLRDYLEDKVDESFYLSNYNSIFGNALNKDLKDMYNREDAVLSPQISQTITTKMDRRVGDTTYIVDNHDDIKVKDYLKIPEATKQGYAEAYDGDGVYINRPHQKRGVVQKGMIQTLKTSGADVGVVVSDTYSAKSMEKIKNNITDIEDLCKTITANPQRATIDSATLIRENLRIRKLTPLECWRLMGIDDECFYKARQVTRNAQLYKQAGNAIEVDVFAKIIESFI